MVLLLDFVSLLSYILIIETVDSAMLPEPDISQKCQRLRICEDAPNYPTELANELIKDLQNKTVIFTDELNQSIGDTNKAQYFDENEPKQQHCTSRVEYKAPRYAKSENGTWDHILNQLQNPIQRFRVEICSSPAEPKCNGNFFNGFETKCVQKFSLKKMYYIENDKVSERYYPVPTCCSCVIYNIQ